MKCLKCGAEFNRNFCPKCGTPAAQMQQTQQFQQTQQIQDQPVFCPVCGTELFDDDRFCPHCGWATTGHRPDDVEASNVVYGTPVGDTHDTAPAKKEKNTTLLIVIIISIVVLLIAGIVVFIVIDPFGGNKENNADKANNANTVITSEAPTVTPTERPTESPTHRPTERPTERPTSKPTERPTPSPTPKPINNAAGTYRFKSLTSDGVTMTAESISSMSDVDISQMYIELKSDGTFTMNVPGESSTSGKWSQSGSIISLNVNDETVECTLKGKTITISEDDMSMVFEK